MKNLRTLRIRRSKLTPQSLKYFQAMPALKTLWLDVQWTETEKAKFAKELPICNFEAATETKYWQSTPAQVPE